MNDELKNKFSEMDERIQEMDDRLESRIYRLENGMNERFNRYKGSTETNLTFYESLAILIRFLLLLIMIGNLLNGFH
jgi:hypothetical protein